MKAGQGAQAVELLEGAKVPEAQGVQAEAPGPEVEPGAQGVGVREERGQ
jgi:hypothetical protein